VTGYLFPGTGCGFTVPYIYTVYCSDAVFGAGDAKQGAVPDAA